MLEKCQVCGQSDLLEAQTASQGGYGPYLLPGTGTFKPAKFQVIVCAKCGFIHWFVQQDDLGKVRNSKHFHTFRPRM